MATRQTKAQIAEENAQLYQQADALNSEIIALREQCEQLRALNDAQRVKIEKARSVYTEMNAEIQRLRAQGSKPAAPKASRIGKPVPNKPHQLMDGKMCQAVWRSDSTATIGWQPV